MLIHTNFPNCRICIHRSMRWCVCKSPPFVFRVWFLCGIFSFSNIFHCIWSFLSQIVEMFRRFSSDGKQMFEDKYGCSQWIVFSCSVLEIERGRRGLLSPLTTRTPYLRPSAKGGAKVVERWGGGLGVVSFIIDRCFSQPPPRCYFQSAVFNFG